MSELRKSQERDRHSNSVIKGGPKKGGGGGKGTWGKGGMEDLINVRNDPHDPNYCSDDDDKVVLSKIEVISPIEAILKEHFSSGDIEETAKSLKEMNTTILHQDFVRKALFVAMEKQAYERELVSKLLSALYGKVIVAEKISEGFQTALDKLDDILLDSPDATDLLAKFLARAIVDETVPPSFLKNAYAESAAAKEVIALAGALTTEKHRIDRLAHIWGPGDLSSVKRLKAESQTLLDEYLSTGDLAEADRCVRKLNAPSFHFQLVKLAIRSTLQKPETAKKRICALLSFLQKEGLLSEDHIVKGFICCRESLNDIKLDVPNADSLFAELIQTGKEEKFLPQTFNS